MESVIKNIPTNESPGTYGLTDEFYQIFKGESITIFKFFQKPKRTETFQTYFMRPL